MPKLSELLRSINPEEISGNTETEVTGIAYDSRRVEPGNLFVCIRGFTHDGHTFIPEALQRGAAALIIQDPRAITKHASGIPVVRVGDTRRALADLACQYYHHPSRQLCLVGVTGTNGKTTTAHLIASLLRAAGVRSATIGTLGAAAINDTVDYLEMERTTPESADLQRVLAQFVHRGINAVSMEVSSHALMLERVRGCAFDVAVFTNLSQDHLDFHRTFEEYCRSKERLFTEFAEESSRWKPFKAVINIDDPVGQRYLRVCPAQCITYGTGREANVRAEAISIRRGGTSYLAVYSDGERLPISMKIIGRFNVSNALAALAVAEALEINRESARKAIENALPLPGRLEMVDEGQEFTVCVDYAHTPDGLEKVLTAAREITSGRLIVLFGCGGDRDAGKRPKMAKVAARLSDFVIITSDNPRSEDPLAIIEQIIQGLPPDCKHLVEPDRRRAIELAIGMAKKGDCVLLAGKGHETYQILRDRTIHFDDREVAREVLRQLN